MATHISHELEAQSIRLRARVHLVALLVSGIALALLGCSGGASLGSGLPTRDASTPLDAADVSVSGDEGDGGGTLQGSRCSGRLGIDAGSGLAEGLVLWYQCESAGGAAETLLPDSTVHGNDGTLFTGSGGAPGYSFDPGKLGNALDLVLAKKGYVSLPAGLLADACEATIATWVYLNSNESAWTRIWDFGQDTSVYMFLTPATNYDRLAKFAITVSGRTNEQTIQAQSAMPTLKWTHVALVLGPPGVILYFDGALVGSSSAITLRPADLGPTVNNYLGRSQYPSDPYLDGDIDEFRLYNRALSPEEILALANGS
jgi:hypothetical protein